MVKGHQDVDTLYCYLNIAQIVT